VCLSPRYCFEVLLPTTVSPDSVADSVPVAASVSVATPVSFATPVFEKQHFIYNVNFLFAFYPCDHQLYHLKISE